MYKKGSQATLWIIVVLLLLSVVGASFLFGANPFAIILLDEGNTYYSYHGTLPRYSSQQGCLPEPIFEESGIREANEFQSASKKGDQEFSTDQRFTVGEDEYLFVTTNVERGARRDGGHPLNPKFAPCSDPLYDVVAYKNGEQIDSLSFGRITEDGGSCLDIGSTQVVKDYGDIIVEYAHAHEVGGNCATAHPFITPFDKQVYVVHKYTIPEPEIQETSSTTESNGTETNINNEVQEVEVTADPEIKKVVKSELNSSNPFKKLWGWIKLLFRNISFT